jgi:glycine/D-amino acid oxidase-like deaminating enzyme
MASVWLEQALRAEGTTTAESLDGDYRADICIVGGGYTGLWTAFELKSRDPSLDIILIEKDICGAGASGANAGYALSLWIQYQMLNGLYGVDEALRLCHESERTIDEIGAFSAEHNVDAQWRRTGSIWGASCDSQSGHWGPILDGLRERQVHQFDVLDREQITDLTGTSALVAGVLDKSIALVHPGHLVRGLRRVVKSMGVRVCEHTQMTRLGRGSPPTVQTPSGTITADKVILGLYGWSLGVRELSRGSMVIFTDAVMTEPVPEKLAELGWSEGPGITDSRVFVQAYRPTVDGRIMWTKAGGSLPYAGRMDPLMDRPSQTVTEMRDVLRAVHPSLADVAITGMWTGPIDRSKNGLPRFGALPGCRDILFGYGYSGSGLVLSRMGSRMLASLALETDDEWSNAGLVAAPGRDFPPEPFRYIGAHAVRAAIARKDRLDHAGRKPDPITKFLLRYKPASYKPA